MKRSTLFLLVPTLLAALALALLPAQQAAVADHHEEGEGADVLHDAMEVINDNFRLVRRQADEPDMNADTADRLAVIIAAVIEAKTAMPATAATDELRTSYLVMMNRLVVELSLAEIAALEGENEALEEHVAAANNIRREGHAAFIPEE